MVAALLKACMSWTAGIEVSNTAEPGLGPPGSVLYSLAISRFPSQGVLNGPILLGGGALRPQFGLWPSSMKLSVSLRFTGS
jgi:hypothetical protein